MRGLSYRVHYQRGDRSIIWDALRYRPYGRVVPDLLVESDPPGRGRLVIDAKYKTYDERRLSTSDIYQAFMYAYAFGREEHSAPTAVLLYPASGDGTTPTHLRIRNASRVGGARIQAVGIRIPQALAEVRDGTPGPVTARLLSLLEQSLPASMPHSDCLAEMAGR